MLSSNALYTYLMLKSAGLYTQTCLDIKWRREHEVSVESMKGRVGMLAHLPTENTFYTENPFCTASSGRACQSCVGMLAYVQICKRDLKGKCAILQRALDTHALHKCASTCFKQACMSES